MKTRPAFRNIGMMAILLGGTAIALSIPQTAWSQTAELPNVTLSMKDAQIRDVLTRLFRDAKVDFGIDPAVQGRITISAKNVPFEEVLKMISRLSATPITYVREGSVYLVKPGKLPEAPTLPAPQTVPQPVVLPNLTLDFKDAPIRAALEEIFRQAKVDFGIDPAVQGYINLKVTDMPFENVLKLILRSSNTPLTYTKDNDVYLVKQRILSADVPGLPALAMETETRPRPEYDRIELTYADPVDLAQLLNITMIPIGTRFGLNVPGATGIIKPGTRGGGMPPGGTEGKSGGTVVGSGGMGSGPVGGGIVGF